VRQHSTHCTDAGQRDVTRVAGQVVTGIGFVCAAFIFRERSILRDVSTAASLFMSGAIGITLGYKFLGYKFLGYKFLGYKFLTQATAVLVITLACLLLERDQHSAAVDDRGSSNSIIPVDRANQLDEP
jgi:uncharacterized membrane protein YhiD involved in acid resistance